MAADHGDADRIVAGLVIGRPVDRAALQKAEAQAVAFKDHRGARGGAVDAGAGMRDADFVEPGDRRGNRRGTVIDVVGDADGLDAGRFQRLAGHRRVGKKALIVERMARGRRAQAAFEVREHDVRGAELVSHQRERDQRIGDVHQVHVAGQDHRRRHFPNLSVPLGLL